MSQDERERQRNKNIAISLAEHIEKSQGPRVGFGKYAAGCVKCKMQPQGLRRYYCPGRIDGPDELQPVRPESPPGMPIPCSLDGEHLHGHCSQCGFRWHEETADAEDIAEATRRAINEVTA